MGRWTCADAVEADVGADGPARIHTGTGSGGLRRAKGGDGAAYVFKLLVVPYPHCKSGRYDQLTFWLLVGPLKIFWSQGWLHDFSSCHDKLSQLAWPLSCSPSCPKM